VPFLDHDRFFAPDIAAAEALLDGPELADFAGVPLWRD
jgi:hypothetical protein